IPAAKVYHKRRTSFTQFYKQLHFFGRARINIYKHFPSTLKLVHFFPSFAALGMGLTLVLNVLYQPLALICNLFVLLYFLLIFFHAWQLNKSIKIAFLSVIASFIQLTAYGFGFMQDFWKRVILNNHD
ncbi:MAG: glycosyltransferase, partial [Pedobacter sp.]